jgi:hypothetical protein
MTDSISRLPGLTKAVPQGEHLTYYLNRPGALTTRKLRQ